MPMRFDSYFDWKRTDKGQLDSSYGVLRCIDGGEAAKFDLVAPIAVFFFADSGYKEAANAALRSILAAARDKEPEQARWVLREESLQDFLAGASLATFDVDNDDIVDADRVADLYRVLFAEIVEEGLPEGWSFEIDSAGAFGYRDPRSGEAMSGDDYSQFPWYADSATLRERVASMQPSAAPAP